MMQGIGNGAEAGLLAGIAIERYNGERYREWSERFKTFSVELSAFLSELAAEEHEHEMQLRALYELTFGKPADPPSAPAQLAAYTAGVAAIEAHFFVTDRSTARTLLAMAYQLEQYTARFYADLAARTDDAALAEVYRALAAFEEEHERLFQPRLAAVGST